jgi:hypothetical protein
MSLDAYSLCPGGTGKKIKFCCGDFLPELQKIDRMVEGEQFLACLKHIDHLREQEPGRDRPCLLATQCSLLRATEQDEAAAKIAAYFLEKHPNNQVALAELAMLAAETDARKALGLIQQAIRAAAGSLSSRTYQAAGLTAGALLHEGFPLPARALLQLQFDLVEQDQRVAEVLTALSQAADIPLLLRDDQPVVPCPRGVSWESRFDETLQTIALADWQSAAEKLAALAADVPDEPTVWRNLATLRGWLADNAGATDALRKYAVLRAREADGLDDAVEAEAEAMFLSDDPLGDRLEMCKLVWTVADVDRAQEAFLSSPRMKTAGFNPAQFSDGQTPPPKAAYMLLDRPMPETAEGLSIESMPRLLGQALLFGRQTDREARLEVMGVAGDELQTVTSVVNEAAGDAVEPEPIKEVAGHWSASQKLLRTGWQPPRGVSAEQLRAMMEQHQREAILDQWPELKLGVLDGHSPRDVAGDEAYSVRLLAAIMVLEYWTQRLPGEIDFNELRSRLGLPVQGPIDPRQHPVAQLPTTRLMRLSIEELSDKDLVLAFYRAGAFVIRSAMRKFATAIVDRPSMADADERLHAYATLARNEPDLTRSMEYISQGRRLMDAKKMPHATWDLMELSLRFAARDGEGSMRLLQHLQERHIEEPGVGETLTRMLIDVGLLRPDGTPAYNPEAPEPAMAAAAEPASEPGALWTPDSVESGGGGKLWTPE